VIFFYTEEYSFSPRVRFSFVFCGVCFFVFWGGVGFLWDPFRNVVLTFFLSGWFVVFLPLFSPFSKRFRFSGYDIQPPPSLVEPPPSFQKLLSTPPSLRYSTSSHERRADLIPSSLEAPQPAAVAMGPYFTPSRLKKKLPFLLVLYPLSSSCR